LSLLTCLLLTSALYASLLPQLSLPWLLANLSLLAGLLLSCLSLLTRWPLACLSLLTRWPLASLSLLTCRLLSCLSLLARRPLASVSLLTGRLLSCLTPAALLLAYLCTAALGLFDLTAAAALSFLR
jgi:hypothetical protein